MGGTTTTLCRRRMLRSICETTKQSAELLFLASESGDTKSPPPRVKEESWKKPEKKWSVCVWTVSVCHLDAHTEGHSLNDGVNGQHKGKNVGHHWNGRIHIDVRVIVAFAEEFRTKKKKKNKKKKINNNG